MNTKHIYHLSVAALLLLTACSGDPAFEGQVPPQPGAAVDNDLVPVMFTVSDKVDFTRAATSIVTFNNNEDIKVFVKPSGAGGYTGYTYKTSLNDPEVPQQTDVSLTPPATPPYFPTGAGSTVEAYAYYPASAVSGATFSVAADQTSNAGYKASDLMFAANRTITKYVVDENTSLAMDHLMAQLHLNITGSGVTVSSVKVNAKRSVTFSVSDAGVPSTSLTGSASDIVAATAAGEAYVCIPVQPINTVQIKVVVSGSGDEADRTATFTFTSTSNFGAGKSYPINLTVSAAQLGSTTAITDWNVTSAVTYAPTGYLDIAAIANQTYNGSAKTPALTVKKGSTTLTANTDYVCNWYNNTNAGTAIVLVRGQGTYDGSVAVAKFTINKAAGSVSYASATEAKTYGNTAFTKTLTKTGDGTVTYSCSPAGVATVNESTGAVTIIGAGSTTITATVADGANYTYAANTASYTLNVAKAALTLTADDKSRSYGTANPALTYTASGFVNGETTSVLTTQPTLSTTANASSEVGTYPITISGAAAANYTISYVNGTLTVISPYTAMSSASASDVGKLICTSGHIHAYGADAGCTADRVAVIAYVGSAGSVETGQSYKGLALALVDCNKDNCSYWSGSNAYEPWCSQSSSYCTSDYTSAVGTAVTKKNGLSMTTTLVGHASHTHHAAKSASGYNASRPSGASAWFLPSLGQWNLIVQGLATKKAGSSVTTNLTTSSNSTYQASNLNSVITGAGGTGFQSTIYWSSTEYSALYAWIISTLDGD